MVEKMSEGFVQEETQTLAKDVSQNSFVLIGEI